VDTVDNGAQRGQPEPGDAIVFTYAGTVDPDLILPGWDGSTTGVTVRIEGNRTEDVVTVRDPSDDSVLTGLGLVRTDGYYADTAIFSNSQMTLSGTTVTIVLGTLSGTTHRDPSAKALVWSTPQGSATESGHPDSNF
jgi:hypothetical protein